MSLTPSHIIQYLYCPRFTYFEYVLGIPQFEEKDFKVKKGREVHDNKLEQNKEYLRRRIGAVYKLQDQYLTNNSIRGQVDEVLTLNDGTMAPLDYKFAEYKDRIYETYFTQLKCYAWLIRDNFGKEVEKGYLVYVRSNNKLIEVALDKGAVEDVKKAAKEIYRIIGLNYYPKATKYKARCLNCTYRNICVK
ncbi:CRISPR-associated protein Cas4 [Marinilongibacter aquaticus]|uniref:CRISPR-associated protein Cas4 n=1 Tax=Marinilongibacter aquaticus TaxID=2975157 RepID=UPI0021BD05C1|nr:CRISPR-associated protein Cas4 [Marinilongibacter aquaticus]UBM60793.1 CRISPR-associated protein Cas4 [Marinilongibacter aquaticus]